LSTLGVKEFSLGREGVSPWPPGAICGCRRDTQPV
jgi:hypothetical protein